MSLLELSTKFVIGVLLLLTLQPIGIAQASAGNRFVVKYGVRKAYVLLPASGHKKSMQQMQSEAQTGRNRFKGMFDRAQVPQVGSIIEYTTAVKDQGRRGTCVAFASIALMETLLRASRNERHNLSEQWVYWASKAKAGVNPNADGSEPLAMLKAIDAYGAPEQQYWPYQENPWFGDKVNHRDCYDAYKIDPVNMNVPTECVTNGSPPSAASQAPKFSVRSETLVETSPESIVGFIQNKIPVEVGFDIYNSAFHFPKGKCHPGADGCPDLDPRFLQGTVSMPDQDDTTPDGGHAVLIVGYNLKEQVYYFKNSWGTDEWASRSPIKPGFGVMPMDYIRRYGEAAVALLK